MLGGRAVKLHSLAEKAKQATGARQREFAAPVVVGIVGLPGSGKRTFCGMLSAMLGSDGVLLLSEDIYKKELLADVSSFRESWRVETSPESIEQGHLASHLDDLGSGCSIFVPEYDWDAREKLGSWQLILPRPVVLVEGLFLFSEKRLNSHFDSRVYLDAKPEVCLERLLSRKPSTTLPPDRQEAWERRFRRFSEEYLEPQRGGADIVIPGDAPFESPLLDLCANVLDEVFARRRK